MIALNIWPTLFVCGADHVNNMRVLIKKTGLAVLIAHEDYVP